MLLKFLKREYNDVINFEYIFLQKIRCYRIMLEEVNDKQLHTPMTKTFKKFRWYPLESRGARPIKFLILLYAISTFHPGGGTRAPCPPDPPLIKRDFCSKTDFFAMCASHTQHFYALCDFV